MRYEAHAYYSMGNYFQENGKRDRALFTYIQGAELGDKDCIKKVADIYYAKNDPERYIFWSEMLLKDNEPKEYEALVANLLFADGFDDFRNKGFDILKKGMKNNIEACYYHYGMILLLGLFGKKPNHKKAIEILKKGQEIDNEDSDGNFLPNRCKCQLLLMDLQSQKKDSDGYFKAMAALFNENSDMNDSFFQSIFGKLLIKSNYSVYVQSGINRLIAAADCGDSSSCLTLSKFFSEPEHKKLDVARHYAYMGKEKDSYDCILQIVNINIKNHQNYNEAIDNLKVYLRKAINEPHMMEKYDLLRKQTKKEEEFWKDIDSFVNKELNNYQA